MELLLKYFPQLSTLQQERFARLLPLYTEWNEKINVISRKDIDHLYLHHVLHALAISKYIDFKNETQIIDVGTGGGFPGIPLAILFPEVSFTLVDSIAKKIKVVNAVIDELQLTNCIAQNCRAEMVKSKFDFVVSRAVTKLPEFIPLVKNLVKKKTTHDVPNGILYLKGGDISAELAIPYNAWVVDIDRYFTEDFFKGKYLVHVCF